MQSLKKLDLQPKKILKIAGIVVVGVIVLVIAIRFVGSSLHSSSNNMGYGESTGSMPMYDSYAGANYGSPQMAKSSTSEYSLGLSARNVAPAPTGNRGGSTSNNAENFEVTEYYSTIETRDAKKTCAVILELKGHEEIIFESSSEYDESCNYTFKVKKENVDEVVKLIKDLDPKDFTENIYTIKKQVDDYTSEQDILKAKLASIDDTLTNAITAYDNITVLANRVQDVESLAKIIESKITIIERLTQERLNVNAQLERIARAKAEDLDKVEYTYFHVYIYENKFINMENLKDSWKFAIKDFVQDINKVLQDISVGLLAMIFVVIQYAIYLFLIVIIVKYCWKWIKLIWKH